MVEEQKQYSMIVAVLQVPSVIVGTVGVTLGTVGVIVGTVGVAVGSVVLIMLTVMVAVGGMVMEGMEEVVDTHQDEEGQVGGKDEFYLLYVLLV